MIIYDDDGIGHNVVPMSVIDKIRAEIKTMSGDVETLSDVLDIIDRYKAESEIEE